MRAMLLPVMGVVTCIAAAASAQSDACHSATAVNSGVYTGTTVGSTNDGSAECGLAAASPDVWYSYAATASGTLVLNTCGSAYDTVLSLHAACGGAAIACNDDTGGTCGLGSTLSTPMLAGEVWLIRVAGYNNAVGAFTLAVSYVLPGPDSCPDAVLVTPGTYTGSTGAATNDGSASCGQSAASPDLWYRIVAAPGSVIRADTCGSSFDTVLSAHTACPGGGGVEIVCNDDTGGACGLGSTITFPAMGGATYYLRVSGFNGARGEFVLNIEAIQPPPGEDDCDGAIEVDAGAFGYTNVGATTDGAASCGGGSPDVWFRYTPDIAGTVTVDTCDTSFDSVLSVHSGCPGAVSNELGCNDDVCGQGSSLAFVADAGATYVIRVGGVGGAAGPFTLRVRLDPVGGAVADAYVGDLGSVIQLARVGDTIACASDTPLCNVGGAPLDTMHFPNARHPFFVFNMYRLSADGRFEQIGQSWVKHMQAAAQGGGCLIPCQPYANGTRLGIGCSDVYSAGYNGTQGVMGPRSEVNPWTGAFEPATSHLNNPNSPPHTPLSHRLQVRDADLDPALHPGAQYFFEQYTVTANDPNHMNSITRERMQVSGAPGGDWSFSVAGAGSVNGPAIDSWADATRTVIRPDDRSDGRCILRAKVTDNGDGTWRYEYAVYNHDLAQAARSFVVPVGADTVVTNIGFAAPRSHDETFHNLPWSPVRQGRDLVWQTQAYAPGVSSNPLRWGTLYNFRFDADRPPTASQATLVPYGPDASAPLFGSAPAPAGVCDPDVNCDGVADQGDVACMILAVAGDVSCFCQADPDFNRDGVPDQGDVADVVLTVAGAACP